MSNKPMAVIIALVLGLGAGWSLARVDFPFLKFPGGQEESVVTSEKPRTIREETFLRVEDQPAGRQVFVDRVTHLGSIWVAVHENHNGEPGNILGAQRFQKGMISGFVDLLRSTKEGSVYHALLHNDEGGDQFDHTREVPLRDEDGNAIGVLFNTISK